MFHLSEKNTDSLIKSIAAINGDKFLILVRGLPGMGKSTFGRNLCSAFDGIQIENDMQFMISGEYVFDSSKLEDAHMSTQIEVKNLLVEGAPCVIVSNTFTRFWEMQAYQDYAARLNYTFIVVDLLLLIKREYLQTQKKTSFPTAQFLEFLTSANVHSVPADKIRSMHDRYEFSDNTLTIVDPCDKFSGDVAEKATEAESIAEPNKLTITNSSCDFKLLDTGYYLALDLRVPEDIHDGHSGVYQACIRASQQILHLYGIQSGYRMIRKLTVRNAKSHGMCYAMQQTQQLTQQPCTNPHVNARSASKLSAGWTRYHVTVLSPTEYKSLQTSDQLAMFLMFLNDIDFQPLLDHYRSTKDASPAANSVGFVQGEVTEPFPFPLDALGERAGLSEKSLSTALYLRMDPSVATLQEIAHLRVRFGLSGLQPQQSAAEVADTASPQSAAESAVPDVPGVLEQQEIIKKKEGIATECWQPHITLAFTHNDVRAVAADPNTWDKAAGVQRFQELYNSDISLGGGISTSPSVAALAEVAQRTIAIDEDSHGIAPADPTQANNKPDDANTDLQKDSFSVPSLAALLLYGELQASFKTDQYGFIVADLKVRKGAMGDDATYRAHSFLQMYLPRGIVYLQHMHTRAIYRALFSLRKFYGKEGVEDDGIGIGASQMNFKLGKVLDHTESILVMEKVNGRAASCRFFRYDDTLYVLVGTKLSHVLCKVDQQQRRLVLPSIDSPSDRSTSPAEEDEEKEEGMGVVTQEVGKEGDGEGAADSAVLDAGNALSQDLILSNVTALQSGIVWERVEEFVRWLGGRTFNGEVLDPKEMHLVTITEHEWMSLCVTDFLVCDPAGGGAGNSASTATATGADSASEMDRDHASASALENMTMLGRFTKCVPAYESFDSSVAVLPLAESGADTVAVRQARKALFTQITEKIVFSRDSEGKVLYFLDAQGRALELLKFKTWWYIWRRSIREVTSQIFSRYYNLSRRGPVEQDPDTAAIERLQVDIDRNTKIQLQMLLAKPEAQKSEKYLKRLDEVNSTLNALNSQMQKLKDQKDGAAKDYDTSFTVIELCDRVQRKWPSKFAFFQAELGERYQEIVQKVIATAIKFMQWCQAQFKALKDDFYVDFKQVFPVVWDRFLAETGCQDVF